MKLIYSGKKKEFTPELERKMEVKFAKLGKMIEQRGEREAHVTCRVERHLHKIEILTNVYDHALKAEAADADMGVAFHQAIESLEKQIVKLRRRWRDTHRDPKGVRASKEGWENNLPADSAAPPASPNGPKNAKAAKRRVFRVDYNGSKPMTLEEAMMEMENRTDYMVYRDFDRNCLSVLIRRPDGNFDLIES